MSHATSRKISRDPAATRLRMLDAAEQEFAEHGLSGARVDAIAGRTDTNVRMIYYYFGSKDGLYRAVLERAYATMRETEQGLALDTLPPAEAIRRLTEFTFDYQQTYPAFVRLVAIENIHRAAHLRELTRIRQLNASVIDTIDRILERGKADGLFREDAEPIGVHLLITAFCFFRVANRDTLSTIFPLDPLAPSLRALHKRMLVDAVLGYLRSGTKGARGLRRHPQHAAAASSASVPTTALNSTSAPASKIRLCPVERRLEPRLRYLPFARRARLWRPRPPTAAVAPMPSSDMLAGSGVAVRVTVMVAGKTAANRNTPAVVASGRPEPEKRRSHDRAKRRRQVIELECVSVHVLQVVGRRISLAEAKRVGSSKHQQWRRDRPRAHPSDGEKRRRQGIEGSGGLENCHGIGVADPRYRSCINEGLAVQAPGEGARQGIGDRRR